MEREGEAELVMPRSLMKTIQLLRMRKNSHPAVVSAFLVNEIAKASSESRTDLCSNWEEIEATLQHAYWPSMQ
jgi:hypothetical protein